MNLRVFNRENDINYIGEGIGYTQGVGVTYEVDFNTFAQLVNRLFKSQKIELEKAPLLLVPDSEIPNYINFGKEPKDDNEQKKENEKINKDAIPEEE